MRRMGTMGRMGRRGRMGTSGRTGGDGEADKEAGKKQEDGTARPRAGDRHSAQAISNDRVAESLDEDYWFPRSESRTAPSWRTVAPIAARSFALAGRS